MLIAVKPNSAPMRVESVRAVVKGRRVFQVLEGHQQLAPGLYERVRVVLSEQECKERRLWN